MNERCYSDELPSATGVFIKLKEVVWLALALLHTMLPVTWIRRFRWLDL
jgi:hypothetical protein